MTESKENFELIQEITKWNEIIIVNNDLIEYAFFRVFIKFEKFFLEIFINYASGIKSSSDYIPNRKLNFSDSKHLKDTLNARFFNINNDLDNLIKNIFDDDNPLSNFFIDTNYSFFQRMITLRNYIAHESPESKMKYIQINLNNKKFIEPSDYLKKNVSKSNHISNYSYFIQLVEYYSEIFIAGSSL